jgi:hypothetical protein
VSEYLSGNSAPIVLKHLLIFLAKSIDFASLKSPVSLLVEGNPDILCPDIGHVLQLKRKGYWHSIGGISTVVKIDDQCGWREVVPRQLARFLITFVGQDVSVLNFLFQ